MFWHFKVWVLFRFRLKAIGDYSQKSQQDDLKKLNFQNSSFKMKQSIALNSCYKYLLLSSVIVNKATKKTRHCKSN